MSHPAELVRWVDDPAASDSLKLALREQGEEGPTSEQRAQLFAQLACDLEEDAPSQAGAAPSSKPLAKGVLWSAGILLLGSASWWVARTPEPRAPSAAPVTAAREVGAPDAPAHDEQAAPPARAAEVALAVDEIRPTARPRPKRAVEAVPATPRLDPVLELSLLTKARRALLDQPLRTLEITAEHERDYPHGLLAEEREVIAIEALVKTGRRDEAVRRAQRFVARFPGSVQRARLDQLLRPAARAEQDGSEVLRSTSH